MGVEGGMCDGLVAGRGAVRAAPPEPDALGDPASTRGRHARPGAGVRGRRAARGDPSATGRWSSCRTSRRSPGSSTRRSRCPTSTRATASRSAGSPRPSSPTASSRRAASGTTSTAACGCWRCRSTRASSATRREPLVHEISRAIPAGAGKRGALALRRAPISTGVLARGAARFCVESAASAPRTISSAPSPSGCLAGRRPGAVSERARLRGAGQLGTIGSGNHFVEVQRVDRVFDAATRPRRSGCARGRSTVLIHSGSRGLGHQVCTDYVRAMDAAIRRVRDHAARPSARVRAALVARGAGLPRRDGGRRELRVRQPARDRAPRARRSVAHGAGRAGRCAARARCTTSRTTSRSSRRTAAARSACTARARRAPSPPARADIPAAYRDVGQPVFVPGSMGTASYVLAGRAGGDGALVRDGLSRRGTTPVAAPAPGAQIGGAELRRELEARRASSFAARRTRGSPRRRRSRTRTSSASSTSSSAAGLARRVARLRPLGVVKG